MSPTERDGVLQNFGIIRDTFVTTNLNFGSVILQITDAVVMSSVDTSSWNNQIKRMTISYLRTVLYITNNQREDGTGNCLCRGSKGEDISLMLSSTMWKPELTLGIYSLSFRQQAGGGSMVAGMVHGFVRWPGLVLPGCQLLWMLLL